MSDAVVGSVSVEVTPSVKNWNKTLGPKVEAEAAKAGETAGKRFRESWDAETSDVDAKVKPDLDQVALDKIKAQLAELGRKTEHVKVDVDTSKLAGLASGGPSLLPAIAALTPAAAGVVPILGGLVASLATAGAGAAAFAAVAVPAFKRVQDASKTLSTDGPILRSAGQAYADLGAAFKSLQRDVDPAVFSVIGGGLRLVTSLIPNLKPLILGSASAFATLESDASKALKDPFWHSFFGFMGGAAHDSIVSLGRAFGNTFTGIAGLVQAFGPEMKIVNAGLVSITGAFAKFGESSASGKNGPFNSFISFADDIGPKVWKLIEDISKALAPIVGAIASKLPGVITSLDNMVVAATPVADKLGKAFTSGAAKTIEAIASGVGYLATELNKLPTGVLDALGVALGGLAVAKFTGIAGLAGKLLGIGGAASGAEGAVGLLGLSLDALVWPVGLAVGAELFQKEIYKAIPAIKAIDGTAKSEGGYWTIAKKGLESYTTSFDKFLGLPTKETGNGKQPTNSFVQQQQKAGQENNDAFFGNKTSTVTIKVNDKASQTLKQINQSVDDYAKKHPDIALTAKDQASAPTATALKHLQLFTHSPSKTYLTAQDKASAVTKAAQRHLELFTSTPSKVNLKAADLASPVVWSTQKNIDKLAGKSVSLHADVSGLAAVQSLNAQIEALHSKEVTLTTKIQTIQLQTTHSSGPGIGHAVAQATGGPVIGSGGHTDDSNLRALSNGEWVVKASRVKELGPGFMDWVNSGSGTKPPTGSASGTGRVQNLLTHATVNIASDTDVDALGQRLAVALASS